jgi:branched-chain amino acid transport system substrate-binding protein
MINKDKEKILFFSGMALAIVIANSIIYLVSPIENKIIYTNWILLINSSVSAGLSVLLVTRRLKHKILDQHTITHISLAIGLILWLCANVQWYIYELDDVVPEVPSIADLFWIAAYPFFGYSLYTAFREFYQKHQNRNILFITIGCSILFITYVVYITVGLSVLSSSNGIILFSVIVVYPILNVILIVPAVTLFTSARKDRTLSIPRLCESLSLISLVIADSWFVIIYLSNEIEAIWYSNLLIVNHYIIISGGLLWTLLFLDSKSNLYRSKFKSWVKYVNKIPRFMTVSLSLLLVLSFIFAGPFHQKTDSYSSSMDCDKPDNNDLKVGVLLGLSGSSYESGLTQTKVLKQAVMDVEKTFLKNNIHKKVVLCIENTEIRPDVAVAKTKKLIDEGVRIIIGPQTSSELKEIKKYTDHNDVLVISQSSTAPSLSQDDNIFRLLQNDNNQGKKIAEKMRSDGIQLVIPIWRNDQYGNELQNITKVKFQSLGGHFSNYGVKYDPPIGEYAGSLHRINFITWDQKLKALSLAVDNARNVLGQNSYSKIGIYVISYGEVVPLLIQAPSQPDLYKVKWYGSEATAKIERLLRNQKAVEFAYRTNFTSPLISMNETNMKLKALENVTKLELNPNDANVYDALWIAALTENMSQNMNFAKLKANFYKIIELYQGASGNIKLDRYGDRIGNYSLWTIKENLVTRNYEWDRLTGRESNNK